MRKLPQELRSPGRPRSHGDAATEVARLFDLGVDGVLTDFPETAVQVRSSRTAAALLAVSAIVAIRLPRGIPVPQP